MHNQLLISAFYINMVHYGNPICRRNCFMFIGARMTFARKSLIIPNLQQGGEIKRNKLQQHLQIGEFEAAVAYSIKGVLLEIYNNQQMGIFCVFLIF